MATDPNDDIGDDDLVPLAKACKIFLHGHLTKSSLRTEHAKGTLEIIRIANKDFVTRNGIRRMIERCAARTNETAPDRKLAQEKQARAAEIAAGIPRAALKYRLEQLRNSLPAANPNSPNAATGSSRAAAKARLKQLRDSLPATNQEAGRRTTRKKGDVQ